VSTVLLTGVLVLFGIYAVQRAVGLREEGQRTRDLQERRELANLVGLWEGFVTDRLRAWLVEMPGATDLAQRQIQQRQAVPWFDAFYQWELVDGEVRFLWPTAPEDEAIQELMNRPCMVEANRLRITGALADAAQAFERCGGAAAELSRYLAAKIYLEQESPADALRVLQSPPSTLRRELALATPAGVPLRRQLATRDLGITALLQAGQPERAQRLAVESVRQIARLSGPDLELVLESTGPLLRDLPPAERAELQPLVERARRRLFAYHEIQRRLGRAAAEDGDLEDRRLHFVHDTYNRPGFLLVWARQPDNTIAAVQVDASTLLQSLLESLGSEGSGSMAVVDQDGRSVDGESTQTAGVQVPLGRLLPQLSLARTQSSRSDQSDFLGLVFAQLAPLGIGMFFAVISFMAHVTAERRERELMERQEAFMARVTHELKTPLAGIRVMTETLQMGAAEDPTTRDRFLDRILTEAKNLEARIDEVLQAARRPQLRATRAVKLDALAHQVVARWEPRFTQLGAQLSLDAQPMPPAELDPTLIGDALSNLIDNALKYRRTGVPAICSVRTRATARWLVIEVSDNGIGVPKDMRKRIFERFTRVEGDGRGKAGGHGLGLAFVAEAAAAHGGLVECSDGIQGGAMFRIKLRR
jgi:signal transduction histidine kinase